MDWKRALRIACAAPACVPAIAAAEEAASQGRDSMMLDSLVVSATRTETSVMESPVSISVMGEREIKRTNASNIADVLRDVPGLTVDESSLPGMKRIKIRGEEARRGAVLIDGQEITDHTSYGSPILVDPALIERIEVVRGPHSVLYGSKAISGVVNIITKKGGDKPFQGSAGGSFISATSGYTANALVRGNLGDWDYRLFVGRAEEGDRHTPDGDLPNSNSDNKSVSGYLAYRAGDHKIALGVDRYELSSGSTTSPSTIGTAFSKFQLDMPQRDLQRVSLNYDLARPSDWIARLHVDAYYQTIDRLFTQEVAAGPTITAAAPAANYDYKHRDQDTQTTMGLTAQVDWTPHPDHLLITGFQYLRDDLDKSMTRIGRSGIALGTAVSRYADMEAHMETVSVYAEDTWQLPADFSVVFGARQYWINSALDSLQTNDTGYKTRSHSANSPIASATLMYAGIPSTVLRAGFAQGYVYPTLVQGFTGSYFGASSTVRPNPDLKPETSDNWEFGIRHGSGGLTLDASLFRSEASNYIASLSCSVYGATTSPCTASSETTYVNLDKAESTGMELAVQYRIAGLGLTPYATGNWIRRKYFFRSASSGMTGVPTVSGRIGLRHERDLWDGATGWADFYMRGGSRADELSQSSSAAGTVSLTQVRAWRTFNASFGADMGGYHLGLDLLNLTDLTYQTNPDESNQPGRSVILSLRADF
ncbi:TonB-dependent siderophore receptor [Magnetospirillum sp. SS-4]|uniref:TonB-dependent receptor plug domain-containing protein n=1 Tax=Magnetospirillum sp. SS-4 TaxID=2681465 RepID=UPI0015728138|nr:TonB-dependent receptor [Magnetospirillum sp. SS-4]